MEKDKYLQLRLEVIEQYGFSGELLSHTIYGSGHINDTYLLEYIEDDGIGTKYILQRINHNIFLKPWELMENIQGVTSHISSKIRDRGGDPRRETLNVISARDGKPYYKDSYGNYWRAYYYIENSISLDAVRSSQDFCESAVAFGNFQRLLADYPAKNLHETIAGFHDTKARLEKLKIATMEDVCKRASGVAKEIEFALSRKDIANVLGDMRDSGELPIRVTHNDTKLNNIMFDAVTGKGICVIDLDTVMPGLAVNDFGDSIRFGASTGAEDERNLDKVECDMELFELYVKGFIEGLAGSLTDKEIEMLPMGAKVMTYECGVRFLTDYLDGDVYFRIHREGHNLDRARTQFKLVDDMDKKWNIMNSIVNKYK